MRVVAAAVGEVRAELARPVGNARARWPSRRYLVLRLRDERGRVGQGEASPLPGYSPDEPDACARALDGVHDALAPLDESLAPAAAIARALEPAEARLAATPAARFAVETALWDLLAQRRGVSVAECLGGAQPRLAVSALLGPAGEPLDAWLAQARGLRAQGYATLKVKVGSREPGFARELEALARLRAAGLGGFALRLDANGAWSPQQARDNLARLASVRPELVEEPASGEDLASLGACALPWAADESLRDPALRDRLLSAPGCAAVVLKPALLGGLSPAVSLAHRARARGLAVIVTHCFEGPIAHAAACELALAIQSASHAAGLAPHEGLAPFGPLSLPQLREPAVLQPSSRPGLGLPEFPLPPP